MVKSFIHSSICRPHASSCSQRTSASYAIYVERKNKLWKMSAGLWGNCRFRTPHTTQFLFPFHFIFPRAATDCTMFCRGNHMKTLILVGSLLFHRCCILLFTTPLWSICLFIDLVVYTLIFRGTISLYLSSLFSGYICRIISNNASHLPCFILGQLSFEIHHLAPPPPLLSSHLPSIVCTCSAHVALDIYLSYPYIFPK